MSGKRSAAGSGPALGKAPSQRQLRVGEEIRHALADIIRHADFRDPELLDLNITVAEVRVSPDLKNATAFVMPLGGGSPQLVQALNRAAGYFRGQLARAVRLPHIPKIGFELDTSFDYAQHIDTLLHLPQVVQDLKPTDDSAATPDGDKGSDDNGA